MSTGTIDLKDKALELYEAMKKDFNRDGEHKEIYQKVSKLIEPTLKEFATATIQYKLGPDSDRQINKDILKSCNKTIDNLKSGAQTYLTNYAVEKLVTTLKEIAVKYILPIVL